MGSGSLDVSSVCGSSDMYLLSRVATYTAPSKTDVCYLWLAKTCGNHRCRMVERAEL